MLLLNLQRLKVRHAQRDGFLQGVEVALVGVHELLLVVQQFQFYGVVELRQHEFQHVLHVVQGLEYLALALIVSQHPEGDALGAQILVELTESGNAGQSL